KVVGAETSPQRRQKWPRLLFLDADLAGADSGGRRQQLRTVLGGNVQQFRQGDFRVDKDNNLNGNVGGLKARRGVEVEQAGQVGGGDGDLLLGLLLLILQGQGVGAGAISIGLASQPGLGVAGRQPHHFVEVRFRLADDRQTTLGTQQSKISCGYLQQDIVARRRRRETAIGDHLASNQGI